MPIKQSFCYPCFLKDGVELDELFAHAADLGFVAAELWFRDETFPDWAATVKKHGLRIASTCAHHTITSGLNEVEEHDRIEQEIRESIDLAVDYDILGIITFAGSRQDGMSDDEAIDIVAQGLRRVSGYAEEKNINLNLELLNSKVDHPGYLGDHTAWGVKLCEAVNSPRVKLLYDIYHMQIMEGDIIRTICDSIQWIGHFHTAGNPGRNDFDDTQELNYSGICRAIADADYEYYLGHEFIPKGNPLKGLETAYNICNV